MGDHWWNRWGSSYLWLNSHSRSVCHHNEMSRIIAIVAKQCPWPNCVIQNTLKLNCLLANAWASRQNRRQKVLNRGPLQFCWGFAFVWGRWHYKINQNSTYISCITFQFGGAKPTNAPMATGLLQGMQNITTIFMHLVAKLYKNLRYSFKQSYSWCCSQGQNIQHFQHARAFSE